jgi:hypothetical protein
MSAKKEKGMIPAEKGTGAEAKTNAAAWAINEGASPYKSGKQPPSAISKKG